MRLVPRVDRSDRSDESVAAAVGGTVEQLIEVPTSTDITVHRRHRHRHSKCTNVEKHIDNIVVPSQTVVPTQIYGCQKSVCGTMRGPERLGRRGCRRRLTPL